MLYDGFWRDVHASEVSVKTGCLSVDGTGAAGQIPLYLIAGLLAITSETCFGVGGSPDRKNGDAQNGGDVHVGRVHRNHEIQFRHEQHLILQSFHLVADTNDLSCSGRLRFVRFFPRVEHIGFFLPCTKQENLMSMFCQHVDNLLHLVNGVDFLAVGCERCHTNPFFSFHFLPVQPPISRW